MSGHLGEEGAEFITDYHLVMIWIRWWGTAAHKCIVCWERLAEVWDLQLPPLARLPQHSEGGWGHWVWVGHVLHSHAEAAAQREMVPVEPDGEHRRWWEDQAEEWLLLGLVLPWPLKGADRYRQAKHLVMEAEAKTRVWEFGEAMEKTFGLPWWDSGKQSANSGRETDALPTWWIVWVTKTKLHHVTVIYEAVRTPGSFCSGVHLVLFYRREALICHQKAPISWRVTGNSVSLPLVFIAVVVASPRRLWCLTFVLGMQFATLPPVYVTPIPLYLLHKLFF